MSKGLIINEDNSHFFFTRTPEQMTLEHLHEFIDQYADTQVSHLFLCPNAMRVNYRSKVWDSIWDNAVVEKAALADAGSDASSSRAPNWITNARLLDQKGLDPYAIWIDRCRKKGISPWLTMRMNDVHSTQDLDNFMHSTFWKAHPNYWRVPGSPRGYADRALDYGIKDVREHHLSLIRELLERYDPDGLELDWMRFGFHFKPGHEDAGRVILNGFMAEVKALTEKAAALRGHAIPLGVRVPALPESARGLGMDAVAWAKEGLIDMMSPAPFWETADFDIPIERWRELLGSAAKRVKIAPTLEIRIKPCPGNTPAVLNTIETARGFAAAMFHRGADHVNLFNYMDSETTPDGVYAAFLKQLGQMDTAAAGPRRHIVTFTDTTPPGVPRTYSLPAVLEPVHPAQFRIYIGPKPDEAKTTLRIGLADGVDVEKIKCSARLNSVDCPNLPDHSQPQAFPQTKRMLQFQAPPQAPQNGYNLVEVFLKDGPNQKIVWVELAVE